MNSLKTEAIFTYFAPYLFLSRYSAISDSNLEFIPKVSRNLLTWMELKLILEVTTQEAKRKGRKEVGGGERKKKERRGIKKIKDYWNIVIITVAINY